MDFVIVPNTDISELEELTGAASGIIHPIPMAEVRRFTFPVLRKFMHKYGLYTLPTDELIDYLAEIINGKKAIEIGAGMGVIGRSLGIPITDSKMQEWHDVKAYYEQLGQPTIKYPSDVIEMDALQAVKYYKPDIVIGSYITHKWKPGMKIGSQYGVDNLKLSRMVEAYYMIGSLSAHKEDPAMEYLDGIEKHGYLFTRGGVENSVIFRWKRKSE